MLQNESKAIWHFLFSFRFVFSANTPLLHHCQPNWIWPRFFVLGPNCKLQLCKDNAKANRNLVTLFRHLPASQCSHFCLLSLLHFKWPSIILCRRHSPLSFLVLFSLEVKESEIDFPPERIFPRLVHSIRVYSVILVHLRVSFFLLVSYAIALGDRTAMIFFSQLREWNQFLPSGLTGQTIICRVIKATFVATLCILFAFRWPHDKFYVEISWDWSARI